MECPKCGHKISEREQKEQYLKGATEAWNVFLRYRHPRDQERYLRKFVNKARTDAGFESFDAEGVAIDGK